MPKSRRSKGDNGITYIEDKKLFKGFVECGKNSEGKRIRKAFYDKSKLKLIAKMNEFKAKNFGIVNDGSSFASWCNKWFTIVSKTNKPKSNQRYKGLIDNYLSRASWYDEKITDIPASEIKLFLMVTMKELGASDHTISYFAPKIKAIFQLAVEDEKLVRNPMNNIKIPKPAPIERMDAPAWTLDEEIKFLNYIKDSEETYKDLYLLALYTGARLGELCALTWKDINIEESYIDINKSVSRQPIEKYLDKDGKEKYKYDYVVDDPKTYTSKRHIDLSNEAINIINNIPKQENTDLLFSNKNKTGYIHPSLPLKALTKICNKLKISRITFHHTRSTYATRLFEANVQLKTVQKLLGHSTLEMTEKMYVKVMRDVKKDAVNKLDEILKTK